MNTTPPANDRSLSPQDEILIDRHCNEFEDAWKAGLTPGIEDYLDRIAPALRESLLNELVAIEAAHCRQLGDTIPVEDYRARFPGVTLSALEGRSGRIAWDRGTASLALSKKQGDANLAVTAETLPAQLGNYELLEEIARGGMGIVFRARDTALDREVAVKVLQDRFPVDGDVARRFVDEARITGQLQHPSIPSIHQVGKLPDGRPFLAMKLVKGRTLAELLGEDSTEGNWSFSTSISHKPIEVLMREKTADRGRFIAIFEQICHAVGYAHARHVIHRDLKPANVMVGAFGEVQVMDWGLAKVLGEVTGQADRLNAVEAMDLPTEIRSGRDSDSATQAGSVFGTLAFMSPEQAAGEVEKLGPPSDVFGLGAILCVILTGHPPYRGPNAEAIRLLAVRGKLDQAFAALDASGEPELIALAKRCLAVEPADRPANAGVVADTVATLRSQADERARRAELDRAADVARDVERRKRRRVWQGFAAAGLILLLGLSVASMIAAGVFRKQRDDLDLAQRDALAKLWRSKLEEARAQNLTRGPGQRLGALATLREALAIAQKTGLSEKDRFAFRNVAIGCLTLPDVVEEKVWEALPGHAGWGLYFDFDAALQIYAHTNDHGDVAVVRLRDDAELARIPGEGTRPQVYLSPDGRFLAVTGGTLHPLTVWRLDGAGGKERIHEVKALAHVAFRPDSKALAYVGEKHTVEILDLESLHVHELPATGRERGYITFSPDGTRLGVQQVVNNRWTLQIRDADTGKVLDDLNQDTGTHAWSPDGRLVAYSFGDRRIHLWDTVYRQTIGVLEGHQSDGIVLAFEASGEYLLSNDWHSLLRIWNVRGGKQVLVIPAHGPKIAVGKEAERFVVANPKDDRKLRMMKIVPAPEVQRWSAQTPTGLMQWGQHVPVFSPRDDLLAASFHPHFEDHQGFALLAGTTGRTVGVRNENITIPIGFDTAGKMITAGRLGIRCWPRAEDPNSGTIVFGPPQRLSDDQSTHASMSADGSVLAVVLEEAAFRIIHRDGRVIPIIPATSEPANQFFYVAVSPDGKWVASGVSGDSQRPVRIWDAQTGRLVKELRSEGGGAFGFSPDGRWLWKTAGEGQLWRVGSWEAGPAIGGHWMAISPDSRIVATGENLDLIRLAYPETGVDFARLRTDENERLSPRVFSGDGSRLYAWGPTSQAFFVWNLRLIRKQLKELDLDWNLPAYKDDLPPPAKPLKLEFKLGLFLHEPISKLVNEKKFKEAIDAANQALEKTPNDEELLYLRGRARYELKEYVLAQGDLDQALKLNPKHAEAYHYRGHAYQYRGRYQEALADFTESSKHRPESPAHMHDMRARMHSALKQYTQAIAAWERSLEVRVEQASANQFLAWLYVLGPVQHRDAKKALPLAERAVQFGKDLPLYHNTLGIVYYRLDRLEEAIKTLEKAAEGFKDQQVTSNRFVLAMCYHRQGNADKAKQLFDQGVARRKTQANLTPDQSEQMDALEAEAKKRLGGK